MTVGITQQKKIAEHLSSSSVVNFSDVRVWKVANLQVMQWQVYVHSKTNAEADKIQSVLIKQHQLKKSVLNINNFNKNYMSHMILVRNCYVKSMCPLKHLFQCTHTHTHTHTHTRLMALFPGLPGWAGTRKVKPIWILLKQETVSGSGIRWASRSRQITMPAPHHSSFLQAGCPSCHPTNSVKALKAMYTLFIYIPGTQVTIQ